jgi:uncharacterized protein YndB with AHSA1/START domain
MALSPISRRINAPPSSVYRALLDARAIERWRVPDGMSSHVHAFDARQGGVFRISLTHQGPTGAGKTDDRTDIFHGYFQRLVPNQEVVEVVEFETTNPELFGEMMVTTTLREVDGGTEVLVAYDGLPRGVSPDDNEVGTVMTLAKLALLVEAD